VDVKELRKVYNQKRWHINKKGNPCPGFKFVTIEDFLQWFNLQEFNKGCHYCGTTNERSLELYNLRYYATRGGKRGRRLELDRKNPLLPYDNLENVVWCCYWCNNAKSNFFKSSEFENIAKAIGNILNKIETA
jgi:hypothetical protein